MATWRAQRSRDSQQRWVAFGVASHCAALGAGRPSAPPPICPVSGPFRDQASGLYVKSSHLHASAAGLCDTVPCFVHCPCDTVGAGDSRATGHADATFPSAPALLIPPASTPVCSPGRLLIHCLVPMPANLPVRARAAAGSALGAARPASWKAKSSVLGPSGCQDRPNVLATCVSGCPGVLLRLSAYRR
jgi:hypothetical protein